MAGTWIQNKPSVESTIKEIDDICRGNWEIYADTLSGEHVTLGIAGTLTGSHHSSGAGVCYYGTTINIGLLTPVPSGALAYDQTLGQLKRYWAGKWMVPTSGDASNAGGWDRGRWYLSAGDDDTSNYPNIVPTSTTVGLSFNARNYDTFSAYASADGLAQIVPSAAGNYLMICQVTLCAKGTGAGTYNSNTLEMKKNGTAISKCTHPIYQYGVQQNVSFHLIDTVQLASNDAVTFHFTNGGPATEKIMSGSDVTYMCFHRLPAGGSCL